MRFAVNILTGVGASEYSMLAFCDAIDWETQMEYAQTIEAAGYDGIAVPDHLLIGDGRGRLSVSRR